MRNNYHNKLKYNIYMEYWYQNNSLDFLWTKYKNEGNFNFRDKDQLKSLLHNDWRQQEIKAQQVDFKKAIYRAGVNNRKYEREQRQLAEIERKRFKQQKRLERERLKLVSNCSKRLIEEFTEYMNTHFKNTYRLFKRPVFFFIDNHLEMFQKEYGVSIRWMCEFLGVTEQGYYNWIKEGKPIHRNLDLEVLELIMNTWMNYNNKNSGRRKLIEEIYLSTGIKLSSRKVNEYMKLMGIQSEAKQWKNETKPPKEYKEKNPLIKNMLATDKPQNNDWSTTKALEKISIDETYIYTRSGKWLYMNAAIDAYSGMIIGWELGDYRDSNLALKTIENIMKKHNLENSIVHSDRALSYNSFDFINFCKEKNIVQSMNDRPISTQNYPIEKFFDIFKNEFLKTIPLRLRTKSYLKNNIKIFVDHYNYIRIQQRKNWRGYSTPSSVFDLYLNNN